MTWKPGQSGNPRGRLAEKLFADAVRMAVNEDDGTGQRKLRRIAEKLVDAAMGGQGWAIQQIADRLDGKPAQESTMTIENKRNATDWTRDELVAFLNDAIARGERVAETDESNRGPDSVH